MSTRILIRGVRGLGFRDVCPKMLRVRGRRSKSILDAALRTARSSELDPEP